MIKRKISYLFDYFPYDAIIEGEVGANGSKFALIYRNRIVALGGKELTPSPRQGIYCSIIDHSSNRMKKEIEALRQAGNAEMSLWVRIENKNIAIRKNLPEAPAVTIYKIRSTRYGELVDYEVRQYRWYNNHRKYVLGWCPKDGDKFTEVKQSNTIGEIADILSEITGRQIQLI